VTVLSGDTWLLAAATAVALGWAVLTGEVGYCVPAASCTTVLVPELAVVAVLTFIEPLSKLSFCNIKCRKARSKMSKVEAEKAKLNHQKYKATQ